MSVWRRLLRNLRGPWVVDDPAPEPSALDLLDGVGRCRLCSRPAMQDRLCAEHGGLPFDQWPREAQDRLVRAVRGEDLL